MTAVARLTGLEPATPGVTGRYSNQLSYNRSLPVQHLCRTLGCNIPRPRVSSSGVLSFYPLSAKKIHPQM